LEATIFLQQLRSKTAYSHQLIEQNSLSQSLMSQNVTMTQYAQYLKSMYGFVYGFEKMVFPLLKHYQLLQIDNKTLDSKVIIHLGAANFARLT
jgi:heme oxygenase